MAIFTLTDAHIIVNGVTLSDHANSVTVEDTRDAVDITAFGATSTPRSRSNSSKTSQRPRFTQPCSR
jgi:hypothetical protein